MRSSREAGLLEGALTRVVIAAFSDVHRELGFGFLEYERLALLSVRTA
jgi:hypothetical protein